MTVNRKGLHWLAFLVCAAGLAEITLLHWLDLPRPAGLAWPGREIAISAAFLLFAWCCGLALHSVCGARAGRADHWMIAATLYAGLHLGLYATLGASHIAVRGLEWGYMGALGAVLLLACLALPGAKGRRRPALRALLAMSLILTWQILMHVHVAPQAAAAAYDQPFRLALYPGDPARSPRLMEIASERSIPRYITDVEGLEQSVSRIQAQAPKTRHSWTIANPLPNLPEARILVIFDGTGTAPRVYVPGPEHLVGEEAVFLLDMHVFVSLLTGMLALWLLTQPQNSAKKRRKRATV